MLSVLKTVKKLLSGEDVTQMCQLLSLCQLTMKAEKKNIGFSFVTLLTMTFFYHTLRLQAQMGNVQKRMGRTEIGETPSVVNSFKVLKG